MKWALIICFGLTFIITGCGPSKIESENQQLKLRLDSTEKRADKAENDLKAALSRIDSQNHDLEFMTNRLSAFQKSEQELESQLKIFRENTTEAVGDIQGLESILDERNVDISRYTDNYLNTKINVTKALSGMPQSEVYSNLLSIMGDFGDIKNLFDDGDAKMQQAQEEQNDAYHNELLLSKNDYERAFLKYKYSDILSRKEFEIKTNRAAILLSKTSMIDIKLFNVNLLLAQSGNSNN